MNLNDLFRWFPNYWRERFETVLTLTQRSELNRFLCSFRSEFLHTFFFTALINVLMLMPTIYMLQIFDRVMVSYSEFTLYVVTFMLVFFMGIMSFSEWVRGRLLVRLGVRLDTRLNQRVFVAAFEMQNQGKSKEANRLFGDLSRVRQFLTGAGLFAILDAPWTPIYILVLFFLHPLLGMLSIIFCLILAFLAYLSSKVMKEPLEVAGEVSQREQLYLDGKLQHPAVVESMGMLSNMQNTWMRYHKTALKKGRRGLDAQTRMLSITRFMRMFQQSLSLGAGALLVIYGEISPGAMIAANALMGRATHPVDALINAWKSLLEVKKSYLDLETALEGYPQKKFVSAVGKTFGAAITFENVTATAEHRAAPILEEISFSLPPGAALGIMGSSGSGKSTLARVMLGIWPNVEGKVLYEGYSIREQDRVTLGSELGYLPQDVCLFDGTIAENIARFGEVDSGKVVAACQQAGVHEMILRFPKGYDTEIGDGGRFLSGGQRQRIGLARALYGHPKLLVLDEPNANLDDAGDNALFQAITMLKRQEVTVVLITHRLQVMAAMDFALVLENGKIARFGKPRLSDGNSSSGITPMSVSMSMPV